MARARMAGLRPVVAMVGAVCLTMGTVSCTSDTENSAENSPTPGPTAEESRNGRSESEPSEPEPTNRNTSPDRSEPDPRPSEVPGKYADLVRKAAEQNTVRIIVTVRLESTPGQRNAYRDAVENTVNDIFDELAEFDAEKGHVYRNLPMFAAEVDEAALRHLIRSDRVVRVSEDTLEKPN